MNKDTEPEIDTDPGDGDVDDVVFEDHVENTGADYTKKVAKLKGELKEAQEKAAQYLESWQRDKAEFINIRKRDEAAQSVFVKFANEKLILDIIPILDSFDMALVHADGELKKGIEGIMNQLGSVLEKNGVKKFSPMGEEFDPSRAQAIAMVPGEDNKVVKVIQSGYELSGKVIRPAMVKVGEK
jgi:molecular chaperone GrpE